MFIQISQNKSHQQNYFQFRNSSNLDIKPKNHYIYENRDFFEKNIGSICASLLRTFYHKC